MPVQSPMSGEQEAIKDSPRARGGEKEDVPKNERAHSFLGLPLESLSQHSTENLSDLSTYATENGDDNRLGRLLSGGSPRSYSRSPGLARTWKAQFNVFWGRNKGLALVVLAQLFGALMSMTTRLLETEGAHGHGMHPFQVRPSATRT